MVHHSPHRSNAGNRADGSCHQRWRLGKAKEHFQTAKEEWKITKIWKAISDHQDMRDVEVSLVDMEIILEQEDSAKAQKELQDLLFYLKPR